MIAKRRGGSVTHQQIAAKLGVSRQLVTHALNKTHRTRISLEMREKVEQAAQELNYQPRARTTHNIGYVLPIGGDYIEGEHVVLLKVERAARAAGYNLLVMGVENNAELVSLSQTFNPKTVDGVVSPRWYGGAMRSSLPADVPLVLTTDEYDISEEVDVICTDAYATMGLMTRHLLDHDHRCIGLVVGGAQIKQHRDMISGVSNALLAQGLTNDDLCLVQGSSGEVTASIEHYLQKPNAPTAWIAASATYSMAILYGLYRQGLRVPEDVSLMSFADSPSFEAMPVALTATDAFGTQIAEMAVACLIERVKGTERTPSHQYLPAQIIERNSVGRMTNVSLTQPSFPRTRESSVR